MNPHSPNYAEMQEGEMNLVNQWSRVDPTRWIAGVLAGILAMAIAMVLAGIFSRVAGMDFLFPVKLMATPVLGSSATEFAAGAGSVIVGAFVLALIGGFWGLVYSHFVFTNSLSALLPMGLVWAVYLWIFNWNLYFQSFKTISVTNLPRSLVFFVCIAYGLSLCSVAFFHRALGGSRARA
jgi:hypothetical protein